MKMPHARSGRLEKARQKPAGPPLPLRVFIGYADLPAVRRATATIAGAVRQDGRNVEVHPMLWRFAQLESSHWRERAISAALDADVIVLASSSAGGLSAGIEDWVNGLLAAGRGRRCTLVAIFGSSDAWTISFEQPVLLATPAVVARVAERAAEPKQRLVA